MLGLGRELAADHEVGRQRDARAARVGRLGQRRARVLDILGVAQRVAHPVPLGTEEREAHRAADDHDVGDLQEAVDHADLVGHLGAADHGHEWPWRALQDLRQRAHLALQQPPGRVRQQVRDALRARMRTVGRAEGVVDVHVGQRGQFRRERRVVARLARLEAHVLEHEQLAGGQLLARAP